MRRLARQQAPAWRRALATFWAFAVLAGPLALMAREGVRFLQADPMYVLPVWTMLWCVGVCALSYFWARPQMPTKVSDCLLIGMVGLIIGAALFGINLAVAALFFSDKPLLHTALTWAGSLSLLLSIAGPFSVLLSIASAVRVALMPRY